MGRPRHPKTDGNQASMVAILRSLGFIVWLTDSIGGDVLDLVCHKDGQTRVVEVKRPGHRDRLTPNEQASIDALAAVGVTVIVAETWRDVTEAWEGDSDESICGTSDFGAVFDAHSIGG